MSITAIRKTRLPYVGGPGAAGVRFDPADNQLKTHDGDVERIHDGRVAGVTTLTSATYTVDLPSDNGKTFFLSRAAGITISLPAVSSANKGQRVTFVNASLPTSNSYAISPDANDRIGFLSDNADIENTEASDVLGDLITLESDGVDGWVIVAKIGTWAAA